MNAPKVTPHEQDHLDQGGRVLIIEEIPGPLWRVLALKSGGCKVLLKPDCAEGYSDRADAVLNARMVANLSEGPTLVRE
jgi:hypothetical protein